MITFEARLEQRRWQQPLEDQQPLTVPQSISWYCHGVVFVFRAKQDWSPAPSAAYVTSGGTGTVSPVTEPFFARKFSLFPAPIQAT
uniref:Uncharacterized protein n=1 Tax=Romanomermis culicivorax TaxID=13658 RepID=A0A915HNK1_ROMCU